MRPEEKSFHAQDVLSIAWGHLTHDTYSAFVSPLLPLLIEKLSLSLTQVGTLTAISQLPAVLNPFIGYLADRLNVRLFVVLAPALTATFTSLLGVMPTYSAAIVLLLAMGVSVAAFHAPAPAVVARVAGEQTGKGMSWFMAAGEMGRTLGPLLAVWAVAQWGLEGMWPVMLLGWGSSALLFWRLHGVDVRLPRQHGMFAILPHLGRVFLPLIWVILFRNMLSVEITMYMPTFLQQRGAALWLA
ncbi:MAG: MFS transporter, partial [Anaerolineae bacterium]